MGSFTKTATMNKRNAWEDEKEAEELEEGSASVIPMIFATVAGLSIILFIAIRDGIASRVRSSVTRKSERETRSGIKEQAYQ